MTHDHSACIASGRDIAYRLKIILAVKWKFLVNRASVGRTVDRVSRLHQPTIANSPGEDCGRKCNAGTLWWRFPQRWAWRTHLRGGNTRASGLIQGLSLFFVAGTVLSTLYGRFVFVVGLTIEVFFWMNSRPRTSNSSADRVCVDVWFAMDYRVNQRTPLWRPVS